MLGPIESALDRRRLTSSPLLNGLGQPDRRPTGSTAALDPAKRASAGAIDTFERNGKGSPLADVAQGRTLLTRGSSGEAVRQLQTELQKRGYKINADGRYGPKTQNAVRRFQAAKGAKVDGIVGPETVAKLQGTAPTAQPNDPQRTGTPKDGKSPKDVGPAAGPISLDGNDKKTAEEIDRFLAQKGSPAAGLQPSAGQMMVDAGKKYGVDPRVLLAIAGHETGYGKLGVGVRKMLGVSAYDHNPNNVNPKFDGVRNQIYEGARTFARLRSKGGATASSDVASQLRAANRAGWATDSRWYQGVGRIYHQLGGNG